MIELIETHMAGFWFAFGFSLLIIEALVLGFSSGMVLFAGIGALITGALMSFGLLPANWTAGIAGFGIASGLSSIVLWKPLKKLQDYDAPSKDNSSDLVGHEFRLESDISTTAPGQTRYSGIDWRVEIALDCSVTEIPAGTVVKVSSVDAGLFRVLPATKN